MVGWGRSFLIAIKAVLAGVLFAIVGILIMAFGAIIMIGAIDPYTFSIRASAWLGILLMVIGFSISSLGFFAALIRFTASEVISELRAASASLVTAQVAQPTPTTASTTPNCPVCRTPLVWVEQYRSWYCPVCKQYRQ